MGGKYTICSGRSDYPGTLDQCGDNPAIGFLISSQGPLHLDRSSRRTSLLLGPMTLLSILLGSFILEG